MTKDRVWVVSVDWADGPSWVVGSCSSIQGALALCITEHQRTETMRKRGMVLVVTPTTLDGMAGPGEERFLYVPTTDDPTYGPLYDYTRAKLVDDLSKYADA